MCVALHKYQSGHIVMHLKASVKNLGKGTILCEIYFLPHAIYSFSVWKLSEAVVK